MKKVIVLSFLSMFIFLCGVSVAFADDEQRLSGKDRFSTAVSISQEGWDKSDTVVLSTAFNFPDALAGGPLSYKLDAPILLTRESRLVDATRDEILRLGATKAVILGGEGVISNKVVDQLETIGLSVKRIGGSNRYETSTEIAKELNTPSTAFVVYGRNFPDALSIAPYASKKGYPILLTKTDRIPEATKEYLKRIENVVIVGGSGVVSDKIMKQMPNATRVSGSNRFETAARFVQKFQMDANNSYIATGYNFADALTGSVLGAKNNGAMLLVRPNNLPAEIHFLLNEKKFTEGIPLGGPNAVSEGVVSKVEGLLDNGSIKKATPIELDDHYTGKIDHDDDVDYYKFTLAEPGNVHVEMDRLPGMKWKLSVLDADKNEYQRFYTNSDSDAEGHTDVEVGLPAGTYYLEVDRDTYSFDLPYRFRVAFESGNFEQEFNNRKKTATPIKVNAKYNGEIQQDNDIDYYQFTLEEAGNTSLQFKRVEGTSWKVEVFNEEGKELTQFYPDSDKGASGTTDINVGLPKGNYYVKVKRSSNTWQVPYEFQIKYDQSSHYEEEYNNTLSQSTPIEVNNKYTGSLQYRDDVDYYKFDLEQDGNVNLKVDRNPGDSWDFFVYDEKENEYTSVHPDYDKNASGTTNINVGLPKGEYYLRVDRETNSTFEEYHFELEYTKSDYFEKEFNDSRSTATPVTLNQRYQGSTQYREDEDYFKFSLDQPRMVTLEMENQIGEGWDFQLRNSDWEQLTYQTTDSSSNVTGSTKATLELSPGDYYMIVDNDTNAVFENYSFTVHSK